MPKLRRQHYPRSRRGARQLANGWLELVTVTPAGKRTKRSLGPLDFVTLPEAAACLGISVAAIYRMSAEGKVETHADRRAFGLEVPVAWILAERRRRRKK